MIWEDTNGRVVVLAHVQNINPMHNSPDHFDVVMLGGSSAFSVCADTEWRDGNLVTTKTAFEKRDELMKALRQYWKWRMCGVDELQIVDVSLPLMNTNLER
jgi:hypothetical protein